MSTPKPNNARHFGCAWYLKLTGALLVGLIMLGLTLEIGSKPGGSVTGLLITALVIMITSSGLTWYLLGKFKIKSSSPEPKTPEPAASSPGSQVLQSNLLWEINQKGGKTYYTRKGDNLYQAAEILKNLENIPAHTYYVVDTPDGSLGRDKVEFYTEAPLKTENLIVKSRSNSQESVEFISLLGFGDVMANQTTVAFLRQNGKYARLVLLMKCGACGYESPVETQGGPLVRECYACGVKNTGNRATMNVWLDSGSVEI